MTRTALPARLAAGVALTLVTFCSSVAVAGVAAADDAVTPASSVAAPAAPVAPAPAAAPVVPAPAAAPVAPAPVANDDDDDDDEKGSKSGKDDDDDDKDDDGKGKGGKDDEVVAQPVEYSGGDVIDSLGSLVAKKAPQLTPKFEAAAPQLRNALAAHLTKKGAQVTTDARGRLVIAPYLCNPKVHKLLQPGCVTKLPKPGGDRF